MERSGQVAVGGSEGAECGWGDAPGLAPEAGQKKKNGRIPRPVTLLGGEAVVFVPVGAGCPLLPKEGGRPKRFSTYSSLRGSVF